MAMRLALMWSLQSQFAGYVVARERMLPELELLARTPGRSPIGDLLDGRAEFGVVSPVHLLAAGPPARDLVLVALFMSRSPVRLAGLRARVGDELAPRPALRVGVWSGEDTELRAMLRAVGAEAEFVPVLDEVAALLDGDVDYVQCTTYNELPAIAAAAGGTGALAVHDPARWGVDVAKDGIAVRSDVLEARPDRFVRGAVVGWRAAAADPAAAAAAVCRAAVGLDPDAERELLERVLELRDLDHALGEPRAVEVARAVHAMQVAGGAAGAEDVRVDRGPWERAGG
jgi:hypothetical protein